MRSEDVDDTCLSTELLLFNPPVATEFGWEKSRRRVAVLSEGA